MLSGVLRLAIAAWILYLLARAGRAAFAQRALLLTIWRRIRIRHVFGSLGLLVVVGSVAVGLISSVPGMQYGLGTIVGFAGNAVFVPLEEAAGLAGTPPSTGVDWVLLVLSTGFLGALGLMLPWLAFVEEEVFRAGLETASLGREILAALVFGAAHLIMLVPVGAAVAVGVAGFVYGRVYRRAYRRATHDDHSELPEPVARAFRSTKRSRKAADEMRRPPEEVEPTGIGPFPTAVVDRTPERRQAVGVLHSAVWHTAFNTLVVILVWLSLTLAAVSGPPA